MAVTYMGFVCVIQQDLQCYMYMYNHVGHTVVCCMHNGGQLWAGAILLQGPSNDQLILS